MAKFFPRPGKLFLEIKLLNLRDVNLLSKMKIVMSRPRSMLNRRLLWIYSWPFWVWTKKCAGFTVERCFSSILKLLLGEVPFVNSRLDLEPIQDPIGKSQQRDYRSGAPVPGSDGLTWGSEDVHCCLHLWITFAFRYSTIVVL